MKDSLWASGQASYIRAFPGVGWGQNLLENGTSRGKHEVLQQLLVDDALTFDLLKMTVNPNHQ